MLSLIALMIAYPPLTTPGLTDLRVTQANIAETICTRGWSAKQRPSVSYTESIKRKQMRSLHLGGRISDYEEDHLIPLELGGDPRSPLNLWPEPTTSSRLKDKVENYLHNQVCNGFIPLKTAQQEIATDWYKVYLSIGR